MVVEGASDSRDDRRAGRVHVPVQCEHGRRAVDIAVDRLGATEGSPWEIRVVYACAEGCRERRAVDYEPRRIVGSDGRLLPWSRP